MVLADLERVQQLSKELDAVQALHIGTQAAVQNHQSHHRKGPLTDRQPQLFPDGKSGYGNRLSGRPSSACASRNYLKFSEVRGNWIVANITTSEQKCIHT